MNELINKKSMSSLDISELTNKQHKHVIRDIKNMLNELEIPQPKFGSSYKDANNQDRKCYNLPKRECLILASGYNIKLRAKIIDRWHELETKSNIPANFAEALRLAAKLEDEKQNLLAENTIQKATLKEQEPKVTFANSVEGSENSILVRQFAKDLCDSNFSIGQNRLFEWFRENKYMNKNNEPYQTFIDMGVFEVITRVNSHPKGTHTSKTTKITGKGQVYFSNRIKPKQLSLT